MNLVATNIHGCYLIKSERYADPRGFFQEIYSEKTYGACAQKWLQANWSVSRRHVVRGLHKAPFAKLCTCVVGRIFDVVVDLRKDSPTYREWYGVWLSAENGLQMYVPPDCGHGFFAAEDSTLIYLQSGLYNPAAEVTVHWQDPKLGIAWPQVEEYILSDKDRNAAGLVE